MVAPDISASVAALFVPAVGVSCQHGRRRRQHESRQQKRDEANMALALSHIHYPHFEYSAMEKLRAAPVALDRTLELQHCKQIDMICIVNQSGMIFSKSMCSS